MNNRQPIALSTTVISVAGHLQGGATLLLVYKTGLL
jgi:hypothetical protein